MEDFTITISSADIMYYSAFLFVSLTIVFVLLLLTYYLCYRHKERKDRKEAQKQKEKKREEMRVRLHANSDLGIKMLWNHVHKFSKDYDTDFIEAIDEEMRLRGLR